MGQNVSMRAVPLSDDCVLLGFSIIPMFVEEEGKERRVSIMLAATGGCASPLTVTISPSTIPLHELGSMEVSKLRELFLKEDDGGA